MSAQRDCIHGHLARSCELCAAQNDHATACEQIDRLRAELAALRAEWDALRAAGEAALRTLDNVRVFVTSRERIHKPSGEEWFEGCVKALRAALEER